MVGERGWRKAGIIALFVLPSLVPLARFTLGPMVASVGVSLLKWNLLRPPRLIGLDNYANVLADPDFQAAVGHTLFFIAGYLPLVFVGGLGLALLLNQRLRGSGVFRSAYFLPVVTSWVVVALVWKWLLNPQSGIVNAALGAVGIAGPGLVDRPGLGDAGHHPDLGLEGPRVRHGHPARRAPGHPRRLLRGGRGRRRGRLGSASGGSRCRCCRARASSCS